MRIDYYLSRVFHQLCFGLLVGACAFNYVGALNMSNHDAKRIIMMAGGLVFISGLYNAGAAKPSRMKGAASTWRVIVYMMKIPLFLVLTPLPGKLGFPPSPAVMLGTCIAMVMLASYSKFYREDALAALAAKDAK